MEKGKLYLWLIYVNLFISTFTFGGGYVVVPMIRKYYVEEKELFDEDTLMEMAAIAQSSPGAIAINLTVLAGKEAAGYPGALISGLCGITPPIIILGLIAGWYQEFAQNRTIMAVLAGMQACVTAMIVDLVIDMCQLIFKEKNLLLLGLIPFAFIANSFFGINVVAILAISGVLCVASLWWKKDRGVLN